MSYPCEKCGTCCKCIALVLPHLDRGDGVCIHLSDENLCDVYETRPFVCNIDLIREKLFSDIPQDRFYTITRMFCEALRTGRC